MKQEVINYQFDIIQQEVHSSPHIPKHDPYNFRYGTWKLNDTIERITQNKQYTVKWIGNSHNSNILAFFYCILMGSLNEDGEDHQAFIKLKYSLYQVCRQWLTPSEQKTFVQHLCLIQMSKSVTEFLKKSSHLENILIKIFYSHKRQLRHRNRKKNKVHETCSKVEELQSYCILFPFLSFQLYGQKVAKININGTTFHIVQQKQCIFIVEYNDLRTSIDSVKKKRKFNFTKKKFKIQERKVTEEALAHRDSITKNSSLIKSISYMNVPVIKSSRRKQKSKESRQSEDYESLTQKESRSERNSLLQKKLQSPQPFQTIHNISSENIISNSFKPFQNIRSSVGIQFERKKYMRKTENNKQIMLHWNKNPQIGISSRINRLSKSINQTSGQKKIHSKSKQKSRPKIPQFLQKRRDGLVSKGSPRQAEKRKNSLTNRSKKMGNNTIVPLMPYPMINFYPYGK